ncbi:uncharacterized protein LOC556599 [Danio rerio]|uniref:Si:ch211-10d23.5 n=1 Tax=Danio rerio TaxID=7955 RepID=E9QE82_DANRE|nr:uncharacterized protein LOC556599 [Danio rerio]|eukprot:XP_002666452.2 uncharacterized protein si:ch211-10d23.5 [Danio rerio]
MTDRRFVFVNEEELFGMMKDIDCLYCRIPVIGSKHHLKKRHLRFAIHYKDSDIGKFSIPCYCSDGGHGRSHWHCPMCKKILQRTKDFRIHIHNHGVKMTDKSTAELEPTAVLLQTLQSNNNNNSSHNNNEDTTSSGKLTCQKCGVYFTTASNLRRHERLQHDQDQQPMLCIDAKKAIYVTPKDLHGPRVPIHIRKSFALQILLCELEECWDFMKTQAQNGNPGKECRHLVRTNHARAYTMPPPLCVISLEEMTHKNLLSKAEGEECQQMNSKACSEGVDCVYPILWGEQDLLLERCIYFSVHTGLKDKWCQFGRTRVSFDIRSKVWKCQCEGGGDHSCVHKCLSMWWLFQERPELLENTIEITVERVDLIEEVVMNAEDANKMSTEVDELC